MKPILKKVSMKNYIWRQGYKDKFYVPMSFAMPFLMLLGSIIEIILMPTPFREEITSNSLRKLLRQQMKKRTREWNEEQAKKKASTKL